MTFTKPTTFVAVLCICLNLLITAPFTIDQVRTLLAEKSGEGKTQAVKALLYKYDAGKLSGVKPEDYAALMEEARKL